MAMAGVDLAARRAALLAQPLFRVLQPAELDALLAHSATRRVPAGTLILRKGDPSTNALVVLTGRVRISSVSEEGREVTLNVLGPGEVIGEMSLIDGQERSADASALEECVMLVIERASFLRLLHGNSDLCLRLMTALCTRLRRANAALEDMAMLDLPGRLGKLLLRLGQDYGRRAAEGTRIEVRLSQKDLSTLVGASREKVNRQLRRWEQEGTLGKADGYIVIRRAEQLAPGG